MTSHVTLPVAPTATAPDGSEVRVLKAAGRGGMAHFRFPPGQTSPGVRHRTVDELWYFIGGRGRMWTSNEPSQAGFVVEPGVCVHIAVGTAFQVKAADGAPLEAIGVTMPPWPGEGEAEIVRDGMPWMPTLQPGPH